MFLELDMCSGKLKDGGEFYSVAFYLLWEKLKFSGELFLLHAGLGREEKK